jgi:hypothetical protein
MNSPRAGKAASVSSSAGTNASASLSFLPRYTPKPEPLYVSPTAATEHVNHLRDQDQFDARSPACSPTNDGALFGEQALSLLNTFLDALLYNFLAKGHGTSLSQLRPAITEVLKSKLARDALASADEELHGLIGESDAEIGTEEELTASQFGGRSGWAQDWHLELAFKRMRLRVMVFIRLGDFDDEDEDRFLEDDEQFRLNGQSQDMDFLASPAAVYLASVLEHIAEQALTIAGEAAFARWRRQLSKRTINENEELDDTDHDRAVVEEMDVEKIALNPTLGRLWRTWRKNYRTMHGAALSGSPSPPASPQSHHHSRLRSLNEIAHNPQPTPGAVAEESERHLTPDEIPDGDVSETDIAANIPLPMSENDVDEIEIMGVAIPLPMSANDVDEIEIMGVAIPLPMSDNDVNEIEVPGLAKEFDDEERHGEHAATDAHHLPPRPSSALFFTTPYSTPATRTRSRSIPASTRFPSFTAPHVDTPPAEDSVESPLVDEFKDVHPARASVYHDAIDHPASDVEEEGFRTKLDIWEETNEDNDDDKPEVNEGQKIEDSEQKAEDKEDKKPHSGVVAGAVAGAVAAAAIVGGAFASMTGRGHNQPDPAGHDAKEVQPDEQHTAPIMAKEAAKKVEIHTTGGMAPEHFQETAVASEGLTAHSERTVNDLVPPIKVPELLKKEVDEDHSASSDKSSDMVSQKPPSSQLQAPLEDSDLKNSSSVKVDQPEIPVSLTGNAKLREVQSKLRDTQPRAQLDPLSQIDATRPISTISMSETELVPAPLQMSNHDRTVLEEMNGHNEDLNGIGLAKTSNVPIHSHSPSPPPDQQRSYYLPSSNQSSPKQSPFQGRMENPPPRESSRNAHQTSSRDRSLVGTDDYILARNTSASSRNPALSPLKQVTKASETPQQNGEIPHAVPFYHSPANDYALKQEQTNKRASKENTPKVSPLQTNFAEPQFPAGAVRPSSSGHSISGRSATSTPTGHSAKGSAASSVVPRNLDPTPPDENKLRDFDSLLKNEQTVKYTLTPEDLREGDVSSPSFCGRGLFLISVC